MFFRKLAQRRPKDLAYIIELTLDQESAEVWGPNPSYEVAKRAFNEAFAGFWAVDEIGYCYGRAQLPDSVCLDHSSWNRKGEERVRQCSYQRKGYQFRSLLPYVHSVMQLDDCGAYLAMLGRVLFFEEGSISRVLNLPQGSFHVHDVKTQNVRHLILDEMGRLLQIR